MIIDRIFPKRFCNKRGFTLPELMLVLFIVTLMSALSFSGSKDFTRNTELTNLTYDVALSIKTAQSYSINVKGAVKPDSTITFDTGYGIHIENDSSYLLFADVASDKRYIAGSGDVLVATYNTPPNYKINFCAFYNQGGPKQDCLPPNGNGNGNIRDLEIVFNRPDPDASIRLVKESSGNFTGVTYNSVDIYIKTLDGTNSRTITVRPSGQISIK